MTGDHFSIPHIFSDISCKASKVGHENSPREYPLQVSPKVPLPAPLQSAHSPHRH